MSRKKRITKFEVVERISEEAGITRGKANQVLDVLRELFKEAGEKEASILIRNFLKVKPYITKKRKVKIPGTDKVITVPSKKVLKVQISRSLINELNSKKTRRRGRKKK